MGGSVGLAFFFFVLYKISPRLFNYLIFTPVIGIPLGGFSWAMACIFFGLPVTFNTFFVFNVIGVGLAAVLATALLPKN